MDSAPNLRPLRQLTMFRLLRPSTRSEKKRANLDEHLLGAIDWICRAHDLSEDDGVPHSYDLQTRTWKPSYPETTGYIIPTLFDAARLLERPDLFDRAVRMARWEVSIQLEGGGIQAGTIGAQPITPTIFNTGQALFGFVRAWEETKEEDFSDAARAAARWLVEAQDTDGCWRKFPSPFTSTLTATYNTRSAFALVRAAHAFSEQEFLDAAIRNVEWALSNSRPNGWLTGNCLSHHRDDRALTHTIAYSIRGILEVGVAAERSDLIERAIELAERTAGLQREDGSLPGFISREWKPASKWTCLTGNSQMAVNWSRIAHASGIIRPIQFATAANDFNMTVQDLEGGDPGVRGGIPGSCPINGEYMKYRYPNWAAKFFVDALLIQKFGTAAGVIGA